MAHPGGARPHMPTHTNYTTTTHTFPPDHHINQRPSAPSNGYQEVPRFLSHLGMGNHIDAFLSRNLDNLDKLLPLTDADLSTMGIASITTRRKLQSAIEHLRNNLTANRTTTSHITSTASGSADPYPGVPFPPPPAPNQSGYNLQESYPTTVPSQSYATLSEQTATHPPSYNTPPDYKMTSTTMSPVNAFKPRSASPSQSKVSMSMASSSPRGSVGTVGGCSDPSRKPNASFRSTAPKNTQPSKLSTQADYSPRISMADDIERRSKSPTAFGSSGKRFGYQKVLKDSPVPHYDPAPGIAGATARNRRRESTRGAFGGTSERFKTKKSEAPEPGSYNIPSCFDSSKSRGRSSQPSFLSSATPRSLTPNTVLRSPSPASAAAASSLGPQSPPATPTPTPNPAPQRPSGRGSNFGRGTTPEPPPSTLLDPATPKRSRSTDPPRQQRAAFGSSEVRMRNRSAERSSISSVPYYDRPSLAEVAMKKGNSAASVRSRTPRLPNPKAETRPSELQTFVHPRELSAGIMRELPK